MVDFPAFRYQSEEVKKTLDNLNQQQLTSIHYQQEGMEIFIHSSLLSAALLNMPLHANATGIFKTSITPSALEENIIEINIGKQFSTQYFIQSILYFIIRFKINWAFYLLLLHLSMKTIRRNGEHWLFVDTLSSILCVPMVTGTTNLHKNSCGRIKWFWCQLWD